MVCWILVVGGCWLLCLMCAVCLLCVDCCALFVISCLLVSVCGVGCWSLFVVSCLLVVVGGVWLAARCCMLFVVFIVC